MNLLVKRLSRFGLNQKRFSRRDFFHICEQQGIEVVIQNGNESWYMVVKHRPFIVLSKRLKGYREIFVMYHELGHHLLHSGNGAQALFSCLVGSKDEFEANVVALLALFPLCDIESGILDEPEDEYHEAILRERWRLWRDYEL